MQKTGQWIKERTEGRNWCDGVSEERVEYTHLSLFLKEVGVEHGDVPNHTEVRYGNSTKTEWSTELGRKWSNISVCFLLKKMCLKIRFLTWKNLKNLVLLHRSKCNICNLNK